MSVTSVGKYHSDNTYGINKIWGIFNGCLICHNHINIDCLILFDIPIGCIRKSENAAVYSQSHCMWSFPKMENLIRYCQKNQSLHM